MSIPLLVHPPVWEVAILIPVTQPVVIAVSSPQTRLLRTLSGSTVNNPTVDPFINWFSSYWVSDDLLVRKKCEFSQKDPAYLLFFSLATFAPNLASGLYMCLVFPTYARWNYAHFHVAQRLCSHDTCAQVKYDSDGSLESSIWGTECYEFIVYQNTDETRISYLACYLSTVCSVGVWCKHRGCIVCSLENSIWGTECDESTV